MKPFIYLLLCLASDVVIAYGDFLSKLWVQGRGLGYFFSAYALYVVAIGAWFALIKLNGDLGRSTLIWCVGGIAMSMLIGHFWFGETMTMVNKVGVGLGVVGVVLVAIR